MNLGWRGEPSPCIVPFLVSLRSWELGIDQSLLMFWLYTPSALGVKEEEGITPGPAVIYSSPPPAPSWCDLPLTALVVLPFCCLTVSKQKVLFHPIAFEEMKWYQTNSSQDFKYAASGLLFFFSQNSFCLFRVSHIFIRSFIDPLFCYDDISRVWSWESACSQYKLTILWGIRRPELSHQLKTEKGK